MGIPFITLWIIPGAGSANARFWFQHWICPKDGNNPVRPASFHHCYNLRQNGVPPDIFGGQRAFITGPRQGRLAGPDDMRTLMTKKFLISSAITGIMMEGGIVVAAPASHGPWGSDAQRDGNHTKGATTALPDKAHRSFERQD